MPNTEELLEESTGYESPALTSLLANGRRVNRRDMILAVLRDYPQGLTAREVAEILTRQTGQTVEAAWVSSQLSVMQAEFAVIPAGTRENMATGRDARIYRLNPISVPKSTLLEQLESNLAEAMRPVREIKANIATERSRLGMIPRRPVRSETAAWLEETEETA